jgi:phosphoribosyl-ATP pyrophosphohydrolase
MFFYLLLKSVKKKLDSQKTICYYSYMTKIITSERPVVGKKQIRYIQELIDANPTWHRTKISYEIANRWGWHTANGRPKDISCRDLLRELEKKGKISLPKPLRKSGAPDKVMLLKHNITPILSPLASMLPLCVSVAESGKELGLFKSLLAQYHYLGFDRTVGENIKYLIYSSSGAELSCLLFGSSAWSCAPRDAFIGWDAKMRRKNLTYTTNNMRFLILPWVKVAHLASHILSLICRRIASDWQSKYGHELYLLETFVEKNRFKGTCYRASGWVCVGSTTGRSRNDRYNRLVVPIKDIYLYPLYKNFREVLCNATQP